MNNSNEPTLSELEWIRIQLQRERNPVEAAKLQKELMEKSEILDRLYEQRLKEIENDGKRVVGSR